MENHNIPDTGILAQVQKLFGEFELRLNGERGSSVHATRRSAMQYFEKHGLPTAQDEDWKYSDPQQYFDGSKLVATEPDPLFQRFNLPKKEFITAHFQDGKFDPELSDVDQYEEDGVHLYQFKDAQKQIPELFEAHFARYVLPETDGLTALNTAFASEGIVIHVEAKKSLSKPVLIRYDFAGEEAQHHIRHLFILEEGAELTVIELHNSSSRENIFYNIITESSVGNYARLKHQRIQLDDVNLSQVSTTGIRLGEHSYAETLTISSGGRFIRNDLNFDLHGKHTEAMLSGIYLPLVDEHIDNHTFVDHAIRDGYSNEYYKGIMAGVGEGVFNGKIIVREDAQKTNAFQSNKNVVLSNGAKIDTKPQLEIFADDVKCSHGATVGKLDNEALFYLRSRGIGEREAIGMLIKAFAQDILEKIENKHLMEFVEEVIRQKLDASKASIA